MYHYFMKYIFLNTLYFRISCLKTARVLSLTAGQQILEGLIIH